MKLQRLYSNQPGVFSPIVFNAGLSAVLAEIRVPANRALDTHNLGKTTVGELIDFCLLKGKSPSYFLFKHQAKFESFDFFLEIELPAGGFLTIRRPVTPGSKIDFLRSTAPVRDASATPDDDWDHTQVSFDRAKTLLDGMLEIDALRPWGFRKIVGYLIRSQRDYLDVFQLGKFSGKHQDWKPFVAHLIGMEAETVIALYDKREELATAEAHLASLNREWGAEEVDSSVLDGLISVKRRSIAAMSTALDSFNFQAEDGRVTVELVERTEAQIVALNEEKYRLTQLANRLDDSLQEQQVVFKPADAEALFQEAGVAFGDQLRRDYNQLIAFNRAISAERRAALEVQIAETQARLREVDAELRASNLERTEALAFLREADSLSKYKDLSRELTTLQSDLNTLEAKRAAAARLLQLRQEQRVLAEEYGHLETIVEEEIAQISQDEEGRFGRLRRYFTEIVSEVLGQDAIVAIRMNSQGGLDFTAEFIGDTGIATSGDRGTSYKKLLCIAFDLAMLRTHLDVAFPRFVYHDGALEQLDPRKREKLIGVFRQYAGLGLQPIISLLDSDLPEALGTSPATLMPDDIVLTLHDEGQSGRLFRMDGW